MSSFEERFERLKQERPEEDDESGFVARLEKLMADAESEGEPGWAMFFRARLAGATGRYQEAAEWYDQLLRQGEDQNEPLDEPPYSWAFLHKANAHGDAGDSSLAIETYDNQIARFGHRTELALLEQVAKAFFNKGLTQSQVGDSNSAIATYDDLIARFGECTEPVLLELVATALLGKGLTYDTLGDSSSAITTYDALIARFGDRTEPGLLKLVAQALFNKGLTQDSTGEFRSAIASYDDLITRFGARTELALLEQVAKALLNKGITQGLVDDSSSAIATYDDLIARLGDRTEPGLLKLAAQALFNKGLAQDSTGEFRSAIASYDDLITRIGERTEPAFLEQVALALIWKAIAQVRAGDGDSAIATYDEAARRLSDRTEPQLTEWAGFVQARRAALLAAAGRPEEAEAAGKLAEELAPTSPTVRQEAPLAHHHELVAQISRLLKEFGADEREKFRRDIQQRKRSTGDFLRSESNFEDSRSLLFVLREWNSYTPIIPCEQENDRGGGYFIRHRGKGVVIDPGYDFIENFYKAGGRLHDIDAIVITHAHDDHTADFEALLTLLHQYDDRRRKQGQAIHKVSLYLSIGAERKLSGFFRLREDDRVARLVVLNRCESSRAHQHELFSGVLLTVLPAYHDDTLTADSSVGLCFDFTFDADAHRRVVFTGDTGLYPKDLDANGKPRESADKKWKLLDTKDASMALHTRYKAILAEVDRGGEIRPIDLLVPHLGSIQEYELDPPTGDPDKVVLYANHLGLRGMAILLDQTRPRAAIISEFGSELKDIKSKLVRVLQSALTSGCAPDAAPFLVPGDVTVVYDIERHQFLCHRPVEFADPADLEFLGDGDPQNGQRRTYLQRHGESNDDRSLAWKAYHEALSARKLPYFRGRS
jgi:tetratricopeptide (TPR) repeat protein